MIDVINHVRTKQMESQISTILEAHNLSVKKDYETPDVKVQSVRDVLRDNSWLTFRYEAPILKVDYHFYSTVRGVKLNVTETSVQEMLNKISETIPDISPVSFQPTPEDKLCHVLQSIFFSTYKRWPLFQIEDLVKSLWDSPSLFAFRLKELGIEAIASENTLIIQRSLTCFIRREYGYVDEKERWIFQSPKEIADFYTL